MEKITVKVRTHQTSIAHKNVVLSSENTRLPRKQCDKQQRTREVDKNRQYVTGIMEMLIFLRRQRISLRVYCENDESLNKGNILELLRF